VGCIILNMATFPGAVFVPRTTENLSGVSYDPTQTKEVYAEDYNLPAAETAAIETVLGTNPQGGAATVKARIAALEKGNKSFIITNPTAASDLPLWRVPANIHITAVHLLCKTQIIVGQLWQYDANGLNGATVDASDITGVVDTNVNDDGALSAPAITAGNYLGWKTTSATAGATYAIISFEYTID
jgi:hypothetical protein